MAARSRDATPKRRPAVCVFHDHLTDSVDETVDRMWTSAFPGGKTPFGDLRNMFRRHHCRTLNPYGSSENCPFEAPDCAAAFLEDVRVTVNARPRVPVGYFIRVTKSHAARRADEAVERRAYAASMRRTGVLSENGPERETNPPPPQAATQPPADEGRVGGAVSPGGFAGRPGRHPDGRGAGPAAGSDAGRGDQDRPSPDTRLPGVGDGPVSVGDLFRSLAPRPREGRPDDRPEGER